MRTKIVARHGIVAGLRLWHSGPAEDKIRPMLLLAAKQNRIYVVQTRRHLAYSATDCQFRHPKMSGSPVQLIWNLDGLRAIPFWQNHV